MAYNERSLDDYIDVAQRIADFRDKYPDGYLQPADPAKPYEIIQAQGFEKNGDVITQTFVVVVAAAHRGAYDARPGIGMAWEVFPGRTNFTRGSELQNAETSAWGRAIIAVGASDSKRGIASREEVRNRQAEREDGLPTNADGSLSRSRTSDEQKQAAGVMTDAEQRAHNALAKPPPNTGKVERLTGRDAFGNTYAGTAPVQSPVQDAVDDRWTTDAPSWLVGVDPPEDQPGSVLPQQVKQIHAVYSALKVLPGDPRHADAAKVLTVGAVKSFNDLSYQQAARLLENLHERHTGKMTRHV